MNEGLKGCKNDILDWMYPPVCLLCEDLLPLEKKARDVCEACGRNIPFITKPTCDNCGRPIDGGNVCKYCQSKHFPFQRGFAVFYYEDVRFAIKHFKFKGCKGDAVPLGKWMFEYINRSHPEVWSLVSMIVPVPSHKKRERARGFNQAALLAIEIEKHTGVPCVLDKLLRVKETVPQNQLNDKERLENCRNAFLIEDTHAFKKEVVLLIDDIFTTGATLNACARELYRGGAKEVIPYCLSIVNLEERVENLWEDSE